MKFPFTLSIIGALSLLVVAIFFARPNEKKINPTLDESRSATPLNPDHTEEIVLPIRFHITSGAVMTVKSQEMTVWVSAEDLSGLVLSEINRIWKPAKIQFSLEKTMVEPLIQTDDFTELCESIAQFKRGDELRLGNLRVENISKILDQKNHLSRALNIYLLPFIGSTYQGYAKIGGNHAVVGVWSDKYSGGKKAPVKCLLVEEEPMKFGSLARTIAHEIGHNLSLPHPDKKIPQEVGRLMGGRKQGYALTQEEMTQARKVAKMRRDEWQRVVPEYEHRPASRDGIGKWFMGREIAKVMGHPAIGWLERDEREREEAPSKAIQALDLQETDVIADIGAGSGYYTFRMAEKVPRGKVLALDIQQEMLDFVQKQALQKNVTNVRTHLGKIDDLALPDASLDAALLVDAYHEFSHPVEMLKSLHRALKDDGRVYLLEFRGEDPLVPIKPLHKMTQEQACKEFAALGFFLEENRRHLPWQHLLVFKKIVNQPLQK